MAKTRGAELSLQETAERLDVHYMTAYRYVRTGQLPARRERGEWRVLEADVVSVRFPRDGSARERAASAVAAACGSVG